MAYIVQADIESRFGEANVQKWSQLDADDVTVDSTRIADAISTAEQDIDYPAKVGWIRKIWNADAISLTLTGHKKMLLYRFIPIKKSDDTVVITKRVKP